MQSIQVDFCFNIRFSRNKPTSICLLSGDKGIRTLDPLLARQVLSQLSYTPMGIWQPPALPYRLQYSTIGRLGLNHRVRDENGCVPQAHRHQKCSYFGFLHRRCALRITTSSLSFFLTCPWQINSNATPTSSISLERR